MQHRGCLFVGISCPFDRFGYSGPISWYYKYIDRKRYNRHFKGSVGSWRCQYTTRNKDSAPVYFLFALHLSTQAHCRNHARMFSLISGLCMACSISSFGQPYHLLNSTDSVICFQPSSISVLLRIALLFVLILLLQYSGHNHYFRKNDEKVLPFASRRFEVEFNAYSNKFLHLLHLSHNYFCVCTLHKPHKVYELVNDSFVEK